MSSEQQTGSSHEHDEHEHGHGHDHDHDHDDDHDHDHENGAGHEAHEKSGSEQSAAETSVAAKPKEEVIHVFQGTEAERAAATAMAQPVSVITETLQLCAERGWKVRFVLKSGQILDRMFITGTDWNKSYIALERVGERHLAPTLIHIPDIATATAIWN